MQTKKMSLHRIIAEIKSLEQKLGQVYHLPLVAAVAVDKATETADAKASSQSAFDQTIAALKNLASLKAARNLANATTFVNIGGKAMSIDVALAKKAALVHQSQFIATLQAQMLRAQQQVDQTQAAIEQKLANQVAAASTGTKKATEEEINVFRAMCERNTKLAVVHAEGLKTQIEALKADMEAFTTEVDYVLSEANATTTVEVDFV